MYRKENCERRGIRKGAGVEGMERGTGMARGKERLNYVADTHERE